MLPQPLYFSTRLWLHLLFRFTLVLANVLCLGGLTSASSTVYASMNSIDPIFTIQEQEWIEKNPTVYFASVKEVAPIEYMEDGVYKGMIAEYLKVISNKTGLHFEKIKTNDWAEAQQAFRDGKIQIFPYITNFRINDMPAGQLLFTEAYFTTQAILVTKMSEPVIVNIQELKGKVVAIFGTTTIARFLSSQYPDIRILRTKGPKQALEAVSQGEAYAAIGPEETFLSLMRRQYIGLSIAGSWSQHPYIAQMGIRADLPMLFSIINKTLRSLSVEEINQIDENWLGRTNYGKPSLWSILKYRSPNLALAIFGIILLAFFAWHARIAKHRAERSDQAKSLFLATMSHEIRTPLNAIIGNLELLSRSSLSEQQNDRLQTIITSSNNLLGIINDILDFSKVEAGQMTIETIRFDLVDTIEQIAAMFETIANAKGLKLYYVIEPTLYRYYHGDPARIRQITMNLVSNAIKFTEAGMVTLTVSAAHTGTPNTQIIISVADTGIGISLHHQKEIFDAFSQADSSITRRFGGTGLGLALCRRMTELMNGSISLTSDVEGSTFVVTLPMQPATECGIRHAPFNDAPRITLLYAAPEWRAAILPHLQQWGLSVTLVNDLQEKPLFPLLIFGHLHHSNYTDKNLLANQSFIHATEDGPRLPTLEQQPIIVSCYSLDGLYAAIARIIGQLNDSETHSATPLPTETPPIRILVAEDHPANQELIRDQLNTLGYIADIVENGRVALRYFGERHYDIVMTDLSMPTMDGYTLAVFLRDQGAQVPILAITAALTGAAELRRCEQVGISGILLKPMSLDDIDKTVRQHLKRATDSSAVSVIAKKTPVRGPLPKELREVLASSCEESLNTALDALKQNDFKTVLERLHAIKGAFAMIHENHLVSLCQQMEAQGVQGKRAELVEGLKQFTILAHTTLQAREH